MEKSLELQEKEESGFVLTMYIKEGFEFSQALPQLVVEISDRDNNQTEFTLLMDQKPVAMALMETQPDKKTLFFHQLEVLENHHTQLIDLIHILLREILKKENEPEYFLEFSVEARELMDHLLLRDFRTTQNSLPWKTGNVIILGMGSKNRYKLFHSPFLFGLLEERASPVFKASA